MVELEIDGKTYHAEAGESLLKVCLSRGLDLPYFCWHPSLGSVGACRQCAVIQYQNAEDQKGRLVMACMTPVSEGMRISLEEPRAREFRAEVIEFLMTNHPHDCPVCEEGGECHLQDMTVMSGHTFRRYRGLKRTHRNQYLGPFINHEMNRCIACYRCVRFYQDYAGGSDLGVFAAHNHVYFGRHEDGVLENEFSGNLVEVCPTGVFTDRTFSAHYARKWDLQTAPSICVHCGIGCNISPGERYGTLRRVVNRYHGEINGYFLCDRGRFGYGFVNGERRLRRAMAGNEPLSGQQGAVRRLAAVVAEAEHLIGIGSPRASLEANFALRELVGAERFFLGIEERELELLRLITEILHQTPVRAATLKEVEQADAVLILGEDVMQTAPRLALALRQSVRNRAFEIAGELRIPRWQDTAVREAAQSERSPLFVLASHATRLDDVASATHRAAPDDLARLAFAVAHHLDASFPGPEELEPEDDALVRQIADGLGRARRPLIVSGTGSRSRSLLEAAAMVAQALSAGRGGEPAAVHFAVPECNSLGLALMGGPGMAEALGGAFRGVAQTFVVLENDLYRRAERESVERLLGAARDIVVLDHVSHGTTRRASLALPAAAFAESGGTFINSEGRAQRFFPVMAPPAEVQESWHWLSEAMGSRWAHRDEVTRACAEALPVFRSIVEAAPAADWRCAGSKVPRQPHRYSGRTAMRANVDIHEPKAIADEDSPLAYSMEGVLGPCSPALMPGAWAPAWNSNQAITKFQDEVGGPLHGGDPGIRILEPCREAAPFRFEEIPAAFRPAPGVWQVVPLHAIFGGEELSAMSGPILERTPRSVAVLNTEDADALQLQDGQEVEVIVNGEHFRFAACSHPDLPPGCIGLPHGLPDTPWEPLFAGQVEVMKATGGGKR